MRNEDKNYWSMILNTLNITENDRKVPYNTYYHNLIHISTYLAPNFLTQLACYFFLNSAQNHTILHIKPVEATTMKFFKGINYLLKSI